MAALIWVHIKTTKQCKVEVLEVPTNISHEETTLSKSKHATCDYTASPAGTASVNSAADAVLLGNKVHISAKCRTYTVRTITVIIEV